MIFVGRTFSMDCKVMFRALSLVLTTLFYVGCTTDIVPATGERRFLGYTWQQEAAIGKQSSKEIAAQLELSVKTVEVHKANAARKLGLKGRIDIVKYALLQGWLADT